MSTRCIIAAETETGIKGVYVHSDGYPRERWGKLEVLPRLVGEHGLSKVVVTLLSSPAGWLRFDGSAEPPAMYEAVPGFGDRLPADHSEWRYFTEASDIPWDVEYVYLIHVDGRLSWNDKGVTRSDIPFGELDWQDAGVLA